MATGSRSERSSRWSPNRHVTAANPRGELGSILLIGETDGGRVLTVPLAATDDPTTWRPATAFEASRHQRTIFRREVRLFIMKNVKVEDLDPIDEETVEVHEGHPVDVVLSVRLSPEDSRQLSELAECDGSDPVETLRAALRHYAASRSERTAG